MYQLNVSAAAWASVYPQGATGRGVLVAVSVSWPDGGEVNGLLESAFRFQHFYLAADGGLIANKIAPFDFQVAGGGFYQLVLISDEPDFATPAGSPVLGITVIQFEMGAVVAGEPAAELAAIGRCVVNIVS